MKSSFGNNLTVSLFGESHGAAIGIVLDGLAPGIPLDLALIRRRLVLRQGAASLSTARREPDEFEIVSGFFDGHTTGTPLTILIRNTDTHSKDYGELKDKMRPSHADYTAQCKYHGFQDYRGGGHFSGRITAPVVAAGAICLQILARHGVTVGTHIARCAGITDAALPAEEPALTAALRALNDTDFAVLDKTSGDAMKLQIERAKEQFDSVGGVLETAVTGLAPGLGEPWFWSVESELAHLLFSVPAVKGVEFGGGFALADARGSAANDAFCYDDAGRVVTKTNHSGGAQGGITNGMPLVIRTAIKPTASIYLPQDTVDLATGQNTTLAIKGRHDPAIVHRARAVVDSVVALGLVDLAAGRFGTDWMAGETAQEKEI